MFENDGWSMRDARWWQFWLPQSGFPGGCIMAVVVAAITALAVGVIIKWPT